MKFFEQLRHGTRGDDLPPVDHADHIAVLLGFPHVVGGHNNGEALTKIRKRALNRAKLGGHNNGEALTPVPVQNIPDRLAQSHLFLYSLLILVDRKPLEATARAFASPAMRSFIRTAAPLLRITYPYGRF